MTEEEQLAIVEDCAWAIMFIENPSEKVQLAAVKVSGTIQYIENPSEAVQLAAVGVDGWDIEWVENPSEAVQLAAVNQSGAAIRHIKNPPEMVQLAVVERDGSAIVHIDKPTQTVIKAALTDISFINKVSEYEDVIKGLFEGNELLTKKWLRYGETMRNQQ